MRQRRATTLTKVPDWVREAQARALRDALEPDWTEGGRVHNWRNHVPEHIRSIWSTFSNDQRVALRDWAEDIASKEEWE